MEVGGEGLNASLPPKIQRLKQGERRCTHITNYEDQPARASTVGPERLTSPLATKGSRPNRVQRQPRRGLGASRLFWWHRSICPSPARRGAALLKEAFPSFSVKTDTLSSADSSRLLAVIPRGCLICLGFNFHPPNVGSCCLPNRRVCRHGPLQLSVGPAELG